ncbi:MAG: hypothetical protein AAB343_00630 [Patescibacteria group bacterium]
MASHSILHIERNFGSLAAAFQSSVEDGEDERNGSEGVTRRWVSKGVAHLVRRHKKFECHLLRGERQEQCRRSGLGRSPASTPQERRRDTRATQQAST